MTRSGRKPRKNKKFTNLSAVLSQVVNKYGIEQRLREHTFMGMWIHVVGEPWSSLSRPVFFDYERNLVVAVRDSSVAQELSLRKHEILNNLRKMARSVGIKLNGLRFDIKSYARIKDLDASIEAATQSSMRARELEDANTLPEPSLEELNQVELEPSDIEELENFQNSIREQVDDGEGAAQPVLQRVLEVYERDLRRRAWLRKRSFSLCSACGLPDFRLHGAKGLCGPCFVESAAQLKDENA